MVMQQGIHRDLSVREMLEEDIGSIIRYWTTADKDFFTGMGVDLAKMPDDEAWYNMLSEQISLPIPEKKSYCMIWLENGKSVGHSNINKIVFGEEAFMHLHLWYPDRRKKGLGTALVRLTLPWFFENYQLKKLFSEPYALNPAPHRTLEKSGFQLETEYITTPGWINFEQPVKRWEMSRERYSLMKEQGIL